MKPRLLAVANKKLPEADYRLAYLHCSDAFDVFMALPGRPDNVPSSRFRHLDMRDGMGVRDIRAFYQLFKLLRRERYDVVHFYSTKLILLGPLLARVAGSKAVFTLTGQGRIFVDQHWLYPALRCVWWSCMLLSVLCSQRCLFQNAADKALFHRHLPWFRSRYHLVGSAVVAPTIRREPRPAAHPSQPLRVLTVSRLLPSKGVGDVLEVAKAMGQPGSLFQFVLVGPPSMDYPQLTEQARAGESEGWLTYRGELLGDPLQAEYELADIFLFLSHAEGMPRVMLEAGFAGLYPIAYDIPANRDLLRSGLHPVANVGSVRAAFEALAASPEGAAQRLHTEAQAYQQHIVQEYSAEAFCRRVDRLLAPLADASKAAIAGGRKWQP